MDDILEVLNTKGKILLYLDENKTKNNTVSVTYKEMAEKLVISTVTITKILKELKETGYIEDREYKGQYNITDRGMKLIEKIKK